LEFEFDKELFKLLFVLKLFIFVFSVELLFDIIFVLLLVDLRLRGISFKLKFVFEDSFSKFVVDESLSSSILFFFFPRNFPILESSSLLSLLSL
jgi:hypothetical protein